MTEIIQTITMLPNNNTYQSSLKPDIKEFSVSEISNRIKEVLESNFGYVRVKGEISGLKIASSGHGYFNLKDSFAVLGSTCWRPVLAKVPFVLSDGMEVVILGKITSYGGQSRYQLSVERIEPAGIGAMMQILRERRQKLEAEGLFDKALKKSIPFMPKIIGVVTSITGAVIKDIIHRISDRCPMHVIIWPVAVQGEGAANEISEAIEGFNKLTVPQKPDLIIVARGGGSIEDLWPFNEEIVVRAAFASSLPIISAVGHETDYTLIDLAADLRAPTPTAAAEFAVPVLQDLKYTLNTYHTRLTSLLKRLLDQHRQTLANYHRILKYPINLLELRQQRVDELGFRLKDALPNLLKLKQANLEKFAGRRQNLERMIDYRFLQLGHQTNYLIKAINRAIGVFEHKVDLNKSLLQSLDYNNVLKRGFALIKSPNGRFLSSKSTVGRHEQLKIRFFDGEIEVRKI